MPSSGNPPPKTPYTVPEWLSDWECQELVAAADDLALRGGSLPDGLIQRLHPVEVYSDGCNIVIALCRDAREESGYYIVPLISSNGPLGPGCFREWTVRRVRTLNLSGFYFDNLSSDTFYSDRLYAYSRKR